MKPIYVYPTGELPSECEDLITKDKKTIATLYAETIATKEGKKYGIKKYKDGAYDIAVDATEINNEVIRNALKDLEKKTHKRYKFISKKTFEDKIIDYANHLMKYGEKYKGKNGDYDFSKAKSAHEKTLIIRNWIGELIYEAITYKNIKTLKSLEKIIGIEVEDLIKQK